MCVYGVVHCTRTYYNACNVWCVCEYRRNLATEKGINNMCSLFDEKKRKKKRRRRRSSNKMNKNVGIWVCVCVEIALTGKEWWLKHDDPTTMTMTTAIKTTTNDDDDDSNNAMILYDRRFGDMRAIFNHTAHTRSQTFAGVCSLHARICETGSPKRNKQP